MINFRDAPASHKLVRSAITKLGGCDDRGRCVKNQARAGYEKQGGPCASGEVSPEEEIIHGTKSSQQQINNEQIAFSTIGILA